MISSKKIRMQNISKCVMFGGKPVIKNLTSHLWEIDNVSLFQAVDSIRVKSKLLL